MKVTELFLGSRSWIGLLIMSLLFFIFVAMITGSVPPKQRACPGDSLDAFLSHMNNRIPALMRQHQIPGCSIALVQNHEIAWLQAYGYADLETGRIMTSDTQMRVQSISKSVTAWGVMNLVEQGAIDLDAPVSQYLKSWRPPEKDHALGTITVRHLLSHTAGLPLGDVFTTYSPDEEMPSLKEKLTQEVVLEDEPGIGFSYSNTGYNLLELLIEEVTGLDFSEYMRREVFLPLGMKGASFNWDSTMMPAPPTGYDLNGKPVPVYVYPEKASGGLFATAYDIARFTMAGMGDNPVLSTESIERLYKPVSDKIGIYDLVFDAYGLGHYIEKLPNGMLSISHGGQGSGIMTHFQAVPETGDGIVILTNSQRSWPFIAYLLTDWAQWRGFPSVGMGKIIWGRYALSAIIGMLMAVAFMLLLRVLAASCRRKLAQKQFEYYGIQWTQVTVALAIIGLMLWCARQKYLFLTSVFPILSYWLGAALLIFAVVLLLHGILLGTKTSAGTISNLNK
ncbi:MAG: serine hydrolase domain-containing protein [Syntrophomonadaceae bacterium]|jgi:CubicO group peptidase (beta-lactamase class C family)|nr:beta-lactamase family protein [Syntrophomonadaceae bacterium]